MIHRWENGRVAISATVRSFIASWFPFFDGDAPSRGYTELEKANLNNKRYFKRRFK